MRSLAFVSMVTALSLSGCGETVTFTVKNSVFYDEIAVYRIDGDEEKFQGSLGKLENREFILTVDEGETGRISLYGIDDLPLFGIERVLLYYGPVSEGDVFSY